MLTPHCADSAPREQLVGGIENPLASAVPATRDATSSAKRTARKACDVPGVAQAEDQVKGALAAEGDLAITGYGKLTAAEIAEKLAHLSQVDLAKIDSYERKNENRTTILSGSPVCAATSRGLDMTSSAWRRSARCWMRGDEDRVKGVRSYERSHKDRSGVIDADEREMGQSVGKDASARSLIGTLAGRSYLALLRPPERAPTKPVREGAAGTARRTAQRERSHAPAASAVRRGREDWLIVRVTGLRRQRVPRQRLSAVGPSRSIAVAFRCCFCSKQASEQRSR